MQANTPFQELAWLHEAFREREDDMKLLRAVVSRLEASETKLTAMIGNWERSASALTKASQINSNTQPHEATPPHAEQSTAESSRASEKLQREIQHLKRENAELRTSCDTAVLSTLSGTKRLGGQSVPYPKLGFVPPEGVGADMLAKKGNGHAAITLAERFHDGMAGMTNMDAAVSLLGYAAAILGEDESLTCADRLRQRGKDRLAFLLYKQIGMSGARRVAYCLRKGIGVEKDEQAAAEHYISAVLEGNDTISAIEYAMWLHERGSIEDCVKWLKIGEMPKEVAMWVRSGFAPACRTLLKLYGKSVVDPEEFHNRCDGGAPTVTLVRTTKGSVFGGYLAIPWESSGGFKTDQGNGSFLFILSSPKVSRPIRLPLVDGAEAVRCLADWGPHFGRGDLTLRGDAGDSRFPQSYSGVPDKSFFDGSEDGHFQVAMVYVYHCRV